MSTRSYKRGVADTAHAFAEFERKQSEAIKYVRENFVQCLEKNIDDLHIYITEQEKNALYKFSEPLDIRNLDERDKILTVGILYALANDNNPTEYQKCYIQFLQQYIDVKEYPIGIDISVIEDIDSIATQKAIFQIVIEYLSLKDSDAYDETDIQNDLLNSFNISTKAKSEIIENVEFVYKILGNDGISKKYDITEVISAKMKKIENEQKILIDMLENIGKKIYLYVDCIIYSADIEICTNDYFSQQECIKAVSNELRKEYDSALLILNNGTSKSASRQVFNMFKEQAEPLLEEFRHHIQMLHDMADDERENIEKLLEVASLAYYEDDLKKAFENELLDTFYKLPSIDQYI